MNNQKIILESLSMDLLRAAQGRHRHSHQMADRFIAEAQKRISELDISNHDFIYSKLERVLATKSDRQAEDLLMYSTLIRNQSQKYAQE